MKILLCLAAVLAVAYATSLPFKPNGKIDLSKIQSVFPHRSKHGKPHQTKSATPVEYKKGTQSFANVCGRTSVNASSYIVGGKEAKAHSWPWAGALFAANDQFSYFCTSSLISDKYVLTAAHCADGAVEGIVYLGSHDLREDETDTRVAVNVKRFIVHPEWDDYDLHNDLALLELEENVDFTDEIRPVCLPSYSDAENDFADEDVTVIGWGRPSDSSGSISPVLREVTVPVITNKRCNDVFGIITDEHICTDGKNGKGACNGDSGSSVNYEKADGRIVNVGIVSFGSNQGCESGYPNGDTRVPAYLDYISDVTGIKIEE